MALAFPAMMLMSALGMLANSAGRRAATELDDERRRYIDRLDSLAMQLRESAELQRRSVEWEHPEPAALWTLVGTQRMWRCRPDCLGFLRVRTGTGMQPLLRPVVVAESTSVEVDPVAKSYLRRFVKSHGFVAGAPVTVSLRDNPSLRRGGDLSRVRNLFRAMICQLAVSHNPADVTIGIVVDDQTRAEWDWVKWLPHNTFVETNGDTRRVVIIDTSEADRQQPAPAADVITLIVDADATTPGVDADGMSLAEARVCARRLARYRNCDPAANNVWSWCRKLSLVGLDNLDTERLWDAERTASPLTVPIGTTDLGETVTLDIKEAADGGLGPHGICVGATGSGKSELLRTMVLGLAVRHSPAELNLILIDFKGGATFSGMERLRHVSAVITNLSEEAHLVARMKDALAGELHRRQQLLRAAGNATNISEYRKSGNHGERPALPSLFIVVDEFAELLQRDSEFVELFTAICRVGRSLGVHLLLATQRLDEGRLRGLDSFLSYRICLKMLTSSESRAVLGVADAAELPGTPGTALLRTSDGSLTRFRAFCLNVGLGQRQVDVADPLPVVRRFVWESDGRPGSEGEHISDRTVLQQVVDQLADHGDRAHPVWLPPLSSPPALAALLRGAFDDLSAPIGLIDLPFEQRRTPLVVDARGAGGNIAVVGAPQTGKSSAIRTLITALASLHPSRRLQFYCIDFGGGSLSALRVLPHVGEVVGRRDRELGRRMLAEIQSLIRNRQNGFDQRWTDGYGDVFLVVDNLAAVRDELPDADSLLAAIAGEGLSVGVHVLVTANRWTDIRAGLKDLIGTKIELRLGDPLDSEIDRKQAALVPFDTPGRGITGSGKHFTLAQPESPPSIPHEWRAPRIKQLPKVVEMADLAVAVPSAEIVLGIGERELKPVVLDFKRHQHLLIFGDDECGKTSTLRLLCRAITQRAKSAAQLFVVDYRRGLLDALDGVDSYAFSPLALAALLPDWLSQFERRLPVAGTPRDQLIAGSWWSGPEIFVVVDDYELVGDQLSALLRLVPHAKDVGLHLIVARKCAGAARAMYDPLLSQLREAGCMGLLMSGKTDEGVLIGDCRPAGQPPGRGLLIARGEEQLVQVGWCGSE
jgi:S-DNA-T family DNA segregation ATPase FtsK/SpoIIIE